MISNAAGKEAFVASFVYTVYAWIHDVIRIPLSISIMSLLMSILLVGTIGFLMYVSYKAKEQDPLLLLSVTLIALVAVVALSKYHSPQYTIWFTPILCILIAGNVLNMAVYYVLQFLWYLKFPVLFYTIYTNNSYAEAIPAAKGYMALIFFTVEYIILFWLVWKVTGQKMRGVIHDITM